MLKHWFSIILPSGVTSLLCLTLSACTWYVYDVPWLAAVFGVIGFVAVNIARVRWKEYTELHARLCGFGWLDHRHLVNRFSTRYSQGTYGQRRVYIKAVANTAPSTLFQPNHSVRLVGGDFLREYLHEFPKVVRSCFVPLLPESYAK